MNTDNDDILEAIMCNGSNKTLPENNTPNQGGSRPDTLLEAAQNALKHLTPKGNVKKDFSGHLAKATLSKAVHAAEQAPPEPEQVEKYEAGKCPKCSKIDSDYITSDGYEDVNVLEYECNICRTRFTESFQYTGTSIDSTI